MKELKVLWRNGDITWEEEQSLRETVNDDVDEFLNNNKKVLMNLAGNKGQNCKGNKWQNYKMIGCFDK